MEDEIKEKTSAALDGGIYIEASNIPTQTSTPAPEGITEADETHSVEILENWGTQAGARSEWSRRLADWIDPTTLPKTRTKCVNYSRIGPIKTCTGWKTQTKWLRNRATLIVQLKKPDDIKKDIDECIKTAAIVAAIAAIVSKGAAAVPAAEKLFFACLKNKVASLVSVHIDTSSSWTKWK